MHLRCTGRDNLLWGPFCQIAIGVELVGRKLLSRPLQLQVTDAPTLPPEPTFKSSQNPA